MPQIDLFVNSYNNKLIEHERLIGNRNQSFYSIIARKIKVDHNKKCDSCAIGSYCVTIVLYKAIQHKKFDDVIHVEKTH